VGSETSIAWTDHTFNPWIGCTKVSAGCANCYASALDKRWGHASWGPGAPRRVTSASNWREPIAWNKAAAAEGRRARVFCASLADVFDVEAPEGALSWLWALIRETPHLDWQLLTKRPERVAALLPWGARQPWANVWIGTSVENQAAADERIPHLLRVPAAVRFLSCEPLLEAVDLSLWLPSHGYVGTRGGQDDFDSPIDWIIIGGESGPGARPMRLEWARRIVEQCRAVGTACFVKQLGVEPRVNYYDDLTREFFEERNLEWPDPIGWSERDGQPRLDAVVSLRSPSRKGGEIEDWPEDLRVREFPEVRNG
jgi:protein gp37